MSTFVSETYSPIEFGNPSILKGSSLCSDPANGLRKPSLFLKLLSARLQGALVEYSPPNQKGIDLSDPYSRFEKLRYAPY